MADTDRRGPKGQQHKGRSGPRGPGGPGGPRPDGGAPEGQRADGKRPGRKAAGRGPGSKPLDEEEHQPRLGEARNEHGTRTSRRIRCTRCKKVDHVPGGPRDKTTVMCRSCLEEVKALFEVGVREKKKTKPADCTVCGTHFDLPLSIDVDDEEIVCFDCMQNFTTWQGALNRPETREADRGEARRPGVRLRRRGPPSGSPADD